MVAALVSVRAVEEDTLVVVEGEQAILICMLVVADHLTLLIV